MNACINDNLNEEKMDEFIIIVGAKLRDGNCERMKEGLKELINK